MTTLIVRASENLLTGLGVPGELWISPCQQSLWECVEDSRDHGGHDSEQHERGNEARHQRQHAAYADRPSLHLELAAPCLASRGSVVSQAFHH